MSEQTMHSRTTERGMALVSALLLLIVMTILAVAMFRGTGLLERIAGNTREKQRALHAAESTQTFAEWWTTAAGGANMTASPVACNAFVTAPANVQVCSNALTNVADVSAWAAGVYYTPPGMTVNATAGTAGDYIQSPAFYISCVSCGPGGYNQQTGAQSNSYVIDAVGWGGNANSVAVVESGYNASVTYTSMNNPTKFINLGGP